MNAVWIALLAAATGLMVVFFAVFMSARAQGRKTGADGTSGSYDAGGAGDSCASDGGGCGGGGD